MSKHACLGNGTVLIALDSNGLVKDFYYHYPGLENHLGKDLVHKIGVYVDNQMHWMDGDGWNIQVKTVSDSMATDIVAQNDSIGIELKFCDVVYNEKNIFIREVNVKNLWDIRREVKVYFNQQFNISHTHIGDTAYYDPRNNVVIHYKGRRVFLVNAVCEGESFKNYSVGLMGIEGKDGTYKDAEDGILSGNPIEHGQVDSVIEVKIDIPAKKTKKIYYWITIAKSIERARILNEFVVARTPSDIIKSTLNYWRAWVKNQNFSFWGLGEPIVNLFNRSLLLIRTHVSKNGSIIASGDSDLFQFGRDTYAYVWPRDAAFSALALERAGDFNASRRFFQYCSEIISADGYFMHKYRPDKSLGSSWHPWMRSGKKQFPIQEDETALVIYSLWKHYELSKDLEFIESVYNSLIKKAAEFMVSYRDGKSGLPKASYDLWEQQYGISTFTASAVYGGLTSAGKFARMLGKDESARKYFETAEAIKKAIMKYLYDGDEGVFVKQISTDSDSMEIDRTIDISSIYGIYKFGILELDDERLTRAMEKTINVLEIKTSVGGIARYEGDAYHKREGNIPGNPWVITAMWLAQYYIDKAKNESELEPARKWISWIVGLSGESGVLPEQFDPYTGEFVSATPLTWSHAEFVLVIIAYLEKLESLGICKACYTVN